MKYQHFTVTADTHRLIWVIIVTSVGLCFGFVAEGLAASVGDPRRRGADSGSDVSGGRSGRGAGESEEKQQGQSESEQRGFVRANKHGHSDIKDNKHVVL